MSRNSDPAGDEGFHVSGQWQLVSLQPPVNPVTDGVSFTVSDMNGTTIFSRTIPPGAAPTTRSPGWRVLNRQGTHWLFTDRSGTLAGGITQVTIMRSASTGLVSFSAGGSKANFQVKPGETPVQLLFVLGGPSQAANRLCATRAFSAPGGTAPICTMARTGTSLSCH